MLQDDILWQRDIADAEICSNKQTVFMRYCTVDADCIELYNMDRITVMYLLRTNLLRREQCIYHDRVGTKTIIEVYVESKSMMSSVKYIHTCDTKIYAIKS